MNKFPAFLVFFVTSTLLAQNTPALLVESTRLSLTDAKEFQIVFDENTVSGTTSCISYAVQIDGVPVGSSFNKGDVFELKSITSPGVKRLTYDASCNGTGRTGIPIDITVLDDSPPIVRSSYCAGRRLQINISKVLYDQYKLEITSPAGTETTTEVPSEQGGVHIINKTFSGSDTEKRTITITPEYVYTVRGLGGTINTKHISPKSTFDAFPIESLIKAEIQQVEIAASTAPGSALLQLSRNNNQNYLLQTRVLGQPEYIIADTLKANTLENQPALSPHSATVGLTTPQSIQYQLRLRAYDQCGNTLDSDPITTLLISSTSNINENTATAFELGTFAPYTYSFSVNGVSAFAQTEATTTNAVSYKDQNIRCNELYCYRAEAVYNQSKSEKRSISALSCVLGQKPTALAPVSGLHSSYGKDTIQVDLFWNAATTSGVVYSIVGVNRNGTSTNAFSTTATRLTLKGQILSDCFKVRVVDNCGQSEDRYTCPPVASGKVDNMLQNSIRWTPYVSSDTTPVVGVQVEYSYYDSESGTVVLIGSFPGQESEAIHNPIDENHQLVLYKVILTLDDGTIIYSTSTPVIQLLRLWTPSAFTPDKNGLNDLYQPKGLFFKTFEIKIYNRWGELVYASSDKDKGWDGGGHSPGLYHYYVRVEDAYGNEIKRNGTIDLIR